MESSVVKNGASSTCGATFKLVVICLLCFFLSGYLLCFNDYIHTLLKGDENIVGTFILGRLSVILGVNDSFAPLKIFIHGSFAPLKG
jgi:hypothetical protein